ncbi:MAG: SRPBCC family protein [Myxococcota bacterium]
MAFITRHADIDAPPAKVWSILADVRGWPRWDPDLAAMEEVSDGLVEGGTCVMALRSGLRGRTSFSGVTPERAVDWRLEGLRGLLRAEGRLRLAPLDDEARTRLTYDFRMHAPIGSLLMVVMRKAAVHGTEACVDGVRRLAEAETQASAS